METCKRCLLRELSKDSFQSIYDYIESLPAAQKAGPEAYEQRLTRCRACANLVNGMCSLCGCFAEVRAAKKHQYCPDTPARWKAET